MDYKDGTRLKVAKRLACGPACCRFAFRRTLLKTPTAPS
jgi:hypothetical protein